MEASPRECFVDAVATAWNDQEFLIVDAEEGQDEGRFVPVRINDVDLDDGDVHAVNHPMVCRCGDSVSPCGSLPA